MRRHLLSLERENGAREQHLPTPLRRLLMMEPDSLQWCMVGTWETKGINSNEKGIDCV